MIQSCAVFFTVHLYFTHVASGCGFHTDGSEFTVICPKTRTPSHHRSAPPRNVIQSSTSSAQIWRSSFLIFYTWVLIVIGCVVFRLSFATFRPVRSLKITTYPHRSICKYTSLP